MGSVVFPNANLKIYLDASQETKGRDDKNKPVTNL